MNRLRKIYNKLYRHFGPQDWWPARTRFEVCVGAILTQNTAWVNVTKAIRNLKRARVLTPKRLFEIERNRLASLIRPAGYYNIKAQRLKNFVNYLMRNYNGSLARLFAKDVGILREELLKINGLGPETVDSILLYAGGKPTFVVDAYTKRVLTRHRIVATIADYHAIKRLFEQSIPSDVRLFNEYHALLVRVGKEFCKSKPLCEKCPLKADLT